MMRWMPSANKKGPRGSPCCTPFVDWMVHLSAFGNAWEVRPNAVQDGSATDCVERVGHINLQNARIWIRHAGIVGAKYCQSDVGHCIFHADHQLRWGKQLLRLGQDFFESHLGHPSCR